MSLPETHAESPEASPGGRPACTCIQDPLEALPPDLRPKNPTPSSLREATCPACGLHYLTNRATDVCIRCEQKAPSAF